MTLFLSWFMFAYTYSFVYVSYPLQVLNIGIYSVYTMLYIILHTFYLSCYMVHVYPCYMVHVLPMIYGMFTHIYNRFMFIRIYYMIHVYLYVLYGSCLPICVIWFMFTYMCHMVHVYLYVLYGSCSSMIHQWYMVHVYLYI